MSDFESAFGSGMDAVSLIEGFSGHDQSCGDMREISDFSKIEVIPPRGGIRADTWSEEEGKGQSIPAEIRLRLDLLAEELTSAFDDNDYREARFFEMTSEYLLDRVFKALDPAIRDHCRGLPQIDYFMRKFTAALPFPAYLVRDYSPGNGLIGYGHGTHALVLWDASYIARLGSTWLSGPYSGQLWGPHDYDTEKHVQSLALTGMGRELLTLSAGAIRELAEAIHIDPQAIKDAVGLWLASNADLDQYVAGLYDDVSRRASESEAGLGRIRTWSDRRVNALRSRVGHIVRAIWPEGYQGAVMMEFDAGCARLSASMTGDAERDEALQRALDLFTDLSSFKSRGLGSSFFSVLEDLASRAADPTASIEVCLLLAEEHYLDPELFDRALRAKSWKFLNGLLRDPGEPGAGT